MPKSEWRSHLIATAKLAIPVSLGQLGHIITNLADSIMLGQFDKNHLSAATFSFNVWITPMIFCMAFSMGVSALVANYVGSGDHAKIKSSFGNAMLLYPLLGVVVVFPMVWSSDILFHLGQDPEIVSIGQPYYEIIAWSILPIMVFQVFKQFAEGLSNTIVAMSVSLGGNLLNVVLNYILIHGKLGFEPMGILGAGYSTLISRICMAVVIAIILANNADFKQYFKNPFAGIDFSSLKQLANFSFPIGFQVSLEVGAFAFCAVMIGWLGKDFLAVHNIAISLASVTFILASGVGTASTVRVGNFMGARDKPNLRKAALTAIGIVFVLEVIFAALFFTFKDALPLIFVDVDETVIITHASALLVIAGIFQIPDGIQITFLGILRGMKDVRASTIITVASYWLVGVSTSYILGIKMGYGVEGIWSGFLVGLSVASILLWLRFRSLLKTNWTE